MIRSNIVHDGIKTTSQPSDTSNLFSYRCKDTTIINHAQIFLDLLSLNLHGGMIFAVQYFTESNRTFR